MDKKVMLFRQVFPDWFKDGIVSSLAFNPSEAHKFLLSSYSYDVFTGESSFEHYTKISQLPSVGCLGVTNEEYLNHDLVSARDNHNFDGHVSTDFSVHGNNQRSKKAQKLRNIAFERGWIFENPGSNIDEEQEIE